MMLALLSIVCVLALITRTSARAVSGCTRYTNETVGPKRGHLVIVGGGTLSDNMYEKIIELSNGLPIVVIPTAGGEESYDQDAVGADRFRELGASNVTVLHTYNRTVANSDEFIAPLAAAGGIFFGGGRQWRLVDAYAGTRAEAAFQAVLDRGGVISGSSAGASIQGSFLARGDTESNTVMIGDHTVGFGYMRNTAIDQHVLVRNRQFDMFDILREYPELLGIAVDENTAWVVGGNEAEIIGASYAVVYDGGFWSREGVFPRTLPDSKSVFYFLREGDKYDLKRRQVIESEEE